MRVFMIGALASIALGLGVTSNASADWRFRERYRFDHGRRIVYQERYWAPPVIVTPPPVDVVVPAPVGVVVSGPPVYSTGYYGYYRPYGRYHHYHPHHHHRR